MDVEHLVRTVIGKLIKEVRAGSSLGQKIDSIINRNIEATKKLKEKVAKKKEARNAAT